MLARLGPVGFGRLGQTGGRAEPQAARAAQRRPARRAAPRHALEPEAARRAPDRPAAMSTPSPRVTSPRSDPAAAAASASRASAAGAKPAVGRQLASAGSPARQRAGPWPARDARASCGANRAESGIPAPRMPIRSDRCGPGDAEPAMPGGDPFEKEGIWRARFRFRAGRPRSAAAPAGPAQTAASRPRPGARARACDVPRARPWKRRPVRRPVPCRRAPAHCVPCHPAPCRPCPTCHPLRWHRNCRCPVSQQGRAPFVPVCVISLRMSYTRRATQFRPNSDPRVNEARLAMRGASGYAKPGDTGAEADDETFHDGFASRQAGRAEDWPGPGTCAG